ncbi:MAG: hypothetical protein ACUVWO_04125 [Thermodesulfobacteriota bacterium]
MDVEVEVTSISFSGTENSQNNTINGKFAMTMDMYFYDYGVEGTARANATFTGTRLQTESVTSAVELASLKQKGSLVKSIGKELGEKIATYMKKPIP